MKRLLLFCAMLFVAQAAFAQGPYRTVTIKEIQEVALDSLKTADTLQNSQTARWSLQISRLSLNYVGATHTETLEVVVQVIVPPRVIGYNAGGWTLMVRDTGNVTDAWTNIFVHPAVTSDSSNFLNNGFLTLERGDIVRLRGRVGEFPLNSMNSLTQFEIFTGQTFTAIDSKPVPPLVPKLVSDFNQGNPLSGGKVRYSTGEAYEGTYVTLTGLTVVGTWSPGAGRTNVILVDGSGNTIYEYDVSNWFTTLATRQLSTPSFKYTPPPFGGTVDTLRGVIWTVSGASSNAGYNIGPIFPGDMTVGTSLPYIATHRRNPVTLTSADTAFVTVKAAKGPAPAYGMLGVYMYKRYNNGPWVKDSVWGIKADSTYAFKITPQAANTSVNYFFVAVDSSLNKKIYASSASGATALDTASGTFFYTVLDRSYTIQDIQSTPFKNGRTAYLGATNVTVNGVITVDTSDMASTPFTTFGTNAWYMQAGTGPWSGIWVTGPDSVLAGVKKGDSVSVVADVTENTDVTELINAKSPVTILGTNKPLPAPVVLTTGAFKSSVGNGASTAEPYEGMLIRFNNVTITDIFPYFNDPTEYEIDDGSGAIIVRRDGYNKYSNQLGDSSIAGKTIIKAGNKFSFVQGVVYFTHNRYEVAPRKNTDFGTFTSVDEPIAGAMPETFGLSQNYPNPFNPTTQIEFSIVQAGTVTLRVYNILGQEVRTLINEHREAGHYIARFDARSLPSGMYFYQLQSGANVDVKKMLLMR